LIVIHACWVPGRPGRAGDSFGIWVEDGALPLSAPRLRGRRPKVRLHPFAAPPDDLVAFLAPGPRIRAIAVTLTLPTLDGSPAASPELVRADLSAAGVPTPAQWQVAALAADADDVAAMSSRLAVAARSRADWVVAPSLIHLDRLTSFAADLVRRGRVLPGIAASEPLAVWRPILTGADGVWARALAVSTPPSLFAADPDHPASTRADVLDDLVDAAARAALGRSKLKPGRTATPVVRSWLRALTGPDRRFEATAEQLAGLKESLGRWQRDAVAGPVRAFFRLVEPGPEDEEWMLRFGLQAADEPSLVVDAPAVWRSRGTLPALARRVDAPQELLLGQLGKAARLYPELDGALRAARPSHLTLTTPGAHGFLTTVASTLATAGFGVQLPGWWNRPASRLGLRVQASTPGQPGRVDGSRSALGFDSVADFRYELALGAQTLTADELAGLAELKAPLVRVRGEWVELDPRRLAAGLKLVGRTGTMSVGDLLRIGAGIGASEELPVLGIEADGWLGELLSGQTERRLEPVPTPTGFVGTLRPYQSRGLAWLDFLRRCGLGGVLADDMGLGKTVQLLALVAHDQGAGPSLLICPMSLVGNWRREAGRFTPDLRVHVHHGAERSRGKRFVDTVAAADLVITTYALAARDAADLRAIDWRRIVVDEAQAIKNAATKQATAIRSLPGATRIAVTGTPVENRLADLWSILEFVNPGQLGTAAGFKKRFAEPIERFGDDEAAATLRRYTGPFVLRRVKTDKTIIADLPDKIEMEVLCNLTGEQAALYQALVDDMLARIEQSEGIERRGLILATMTKLKQVCNHPAQFLRDGGRLAGRSGKLEALEEILEEVLAAGEKALLFTQFAEFGALLQSHLTGRFGREVLFLHGGVGQAERDVMVQRFQADDPGAPPLFVLSLKAGGTGLTLTAANHVVHVDRWWNPAVEDQATDRAFRIGQRRSVQVRKFVCAGTIEDKIAAMIRDKRGLAQRIVGSGEQWLTELATGDLAELFRLESGAVVE
jgi:non-specific serine/threonine protein kinase